MMIVDTIPEEVLSYLAKNGTTVNFNGNTFVYYPLWLQVVDPENSKVVIHNFESLPKDFVGFVNSSRNFVVKKEES